MNFVIATEKDSAIWDQFVANSEYPHYMQSFSWGKVKQYEGWRPTFFMAKEHGIIKGVALILSKPLPVIKHSIYYLPRGPVVDPNDLKTLLFLLRNIVRHISENNGIFLRADPYFKEAAQYDSVFEDAGFKNLQKDWSYWNAPRFVFWLKLDVGAEGILKKMAKKKRYEIRSAQKKGIRFLRGDISDIQDFHMLMIDTAGRKQISVHDSEYYSNLLRSFDNSPRAQLFLAKYRDETIAAGISLFYGKRAWLLHLASSTEHTHLPSNRGLQWEMILWAIENGCDLYDFRGTATDDPPNPNDPGYGVYKFKKTFGPDFIRTLGYYDYIGNRLLYTIFSIGEHYILPLVVDGSVKLSKLGTRLGRKLTYG
ncbi:MAG: peptidoglycan bridge formation glycyltransferase FemA/FemB family protein [Thermodesulfobacteriota bacterium]|nr:peptidoglycan bridge formation glycyltransferase FemA/FemB family protein [Thermodesulfobacteriota bacterium]